MSEIKFYNQGDEKLPAGGLDTTPKITKLYWIDADSDKEIERIAAGQKAKLCFETRGYSKGEIVKANVKWSDDTKFADNSTDMTFSGKADEDGKAISEEVYENISKNMYSIKDRILIATSYDSDGVKAKLKAKKGKINLLISIEKEQYNQLLDTINTIWEIGYLKDITKIEDALKKYEDYNMHNIALLHHGSRYCAKILPAGERALFWNTKFIQNTFKQIDENITCEKNISFEEYLKRFKDIFSKKYMYSDEYESYIAVPFYMRILLNSIIDNGNYLSIACDEADDETFLDELSDLATKKIKLYANTNKTLIGQTAFFRYGSKEVKGYGSTLNLPLTNNVADKRGWVYFDCGTKEKTTTRKDIVLNSLETKEKPFSLIPLGSVSKEQQNNRQMYYSKKFKKWYTDNWGKEAFEKWNNELKTKL
jgi:hypothetical protein